MANKSLGLIEVKGFAAALEAADAALKSANVELLGYEFTKGGGLILIKLCGDVGAVQAGVQAGALAASKINPVLSTLVIPRPSQSVAQMLTVGKNKKVPAKQEVQQPQEEIPLPEPPSAVELTEDVKMVVASEDEKNRAEVQAEYTEVLPNERLVDVCNLCGDPICHRKKGDPKINCIYYNKKNNREAE